MSRRPERVVLDTNVVVSSFWGGKPRRIMELWRKGAFKVVVSLEILQEYQDVLSRFHLMDEDMESFLALFTFPPFALLVRPPRHYSVIQEDPSDNMFLDCAVAGKSDCVVSGDVHLLGRKVFQGIPILKPAQFLGHFQA